MRNMVFHCMLKIPWTVRMKNETTKHYEKRKSEEEEDR